MTEVCDVCRFDGAHYTKTDLQRTIDTIAIRWQWAADGVDDTTLATRHSPDELSPAEHAAIALDRAATDDSPEQQAHRATHHLLLATRALYALGVGAARSEGSVAGLFASGGGVPKLAIDEAVIGYRGVEGDRQATRQHHGRVWQALCLWSADVIERFQAEGHPIAFGNAGENITVRGVDWSSLRPGTRLAIGDDVLVEVSAYSTPCKKNAGWYLHGDFNRMSHDREPGVSRLYASVLRDGVIRPGDPVIVEP